MKATTVVPTLALGFCLTCSAAAGGVQACQIPSVDGFGDALDACASAVQVTAYQTRQVNVSPVDVDFGAVKVGALIKVPVTLSNLTNQPLALAGGGFNDPGAFSSTGGTCSVSLPANGSCAFNYYFQPSEAGQAFTAQTSVVIGSTYQTLKFRGNGTESLSQITPITIDFGDALLGQTLVVPVTLRNTHAAAITLSGGGFNDPGAFANAAGSTCGGSGISVGAACVFNYSFTPSAVGATTGSTSIGINASPFYMQPGLTFKGNGVSTAPVVNVYPRSVDFGSVKIGRTASVPVTIKNLTSVALSTAGGGFNDDAGGAFSGASCGNSIPAGQSCVFTYYFQPRLAGTTVSATTNIGLSGSGVSYQQPSLRFTGTGIGTLALVTPTTIDFGPVRTGTSMSVPVTITNTSESALTGLIGGAVPSRFSASNACPASLAVGASCTITYTFSASVAKLGLQSADTVLSFTNNTGVRPSIAIHLDAFSDDPDKIFFNGFD